MMLRPTREKHRAGLAKLPEASPKLLPTRELRRHDHRRVCTLFAMGLSLALSLPLGAAHAQRVAPGTTDPARPVLAVRPEVLTRVEHALMAIDSSASPRAWAALGAEGLAALVVILDDGARPVGLRRRAVIALAHYPGEAAAALLTSLASNAAEDDVVSRHALRVLAQLRGRDALPAVERALSDPRATVREGAVQTLASLRDRHAIEADRARTLLTSLRAHEPERFVQVAIDRSLGAR
ncbi:MAG: HEAT repeat domain-containing protein [Sandaracinaceae bacterium]|nr:HEAT repeat domain-containing protein [Sandaracinaceae bacterium]